MNDEHLTLSHFDSATWSTGGVSVLERDPAHNRLVVQIGNCWDFAMVAPANRLYLPLLRR